MLLSLNVRGPLPFATLGLTWFANWLLIALGQLQEELAAVQLLPADGPIVAALGLPETLRSTETKDYVIGASAEPDAQGRLRGVLCAGLAEAMAASDAGANFVVLAGELPAHELGSLCEMVPVPVYAPGLSLEEAWGLGASGVREF